MVAEVVLPFRPVTLAVRMPSEKTPLLMSASKPQFPVPIPASLRPSRNRLARQRVTRPSAELISTVSPVPASASSNAQP